VFLGHCENVTIKKCKNTGSITGEGIDDVGGIIGTCDSNITRCVNTGEVSATGSATGGIVRFFGMAW